MSLLRPGLHVVRRDDRHLQIGLDPPWRLVVPDDPDVRRVLADLAAGRTPTPATVAGHRAWRDLRVAGMLTPAASARRATIGLAGTDRLVAAATRLLADVGVVPDRAGAELTLLLWAGEPRRDVVDELVREGRPHLLLTAGPGGYRIGPLVVPGQTACLRCVDAHLAEHDPRRSVVVEQLAGRPAAPDDPLLESLAVAWTARDAVRHLDGEPAVSWSATVDLEPDLTPTHRPWRRHVHCGCSWAHDLPG